MELISIIVPVYNVENYLKKCIESILKQTYKNLEIICVNDGSTDNSQKILEEYAQKDDRIKVENKKNGGLSSARNFGLSKAKGSYICFIDSDDYIDVDMIEKMYTTCLNLQCDMTICNYHNIGRFELIDSNENTMVYSNHEALEELSKGNIKSFAWNKMYKRELFKDIKFPEGKIFEDIYIMHLLISKCQKIAIIPDKLYYYVYRENSLMNNYSLKSTIDNYLALKQRLKFLEKSRVKNLEGTYAEIIRVFLYLQLVIQKVRSEERLKFKEQLIEVYLDYKKIRFPEKTFDFMSKNDQLKYKLYKKSKFFYKLLIEKLLKEKNKRRIEKIVKGIFKGNNFQKRIRKEERAVWIIGLPEYNNLGDIAIGYSIIKYVENIFREKRDIFLVTENECLLYWNKINSEIKDDDIILLQGGGNITDLYPDQQKLREKVLKNCKNNKIIIMPQTVYFSNTKLGQKEKDKTYKLFKECKKLILTCREKYTFNWVKENFKGVNRILTPDIVFSLKFLEKYDRKGILLCIRNDKESSWGMEYLPQIKEKCLLKNKKVEVTDTVIGKNVTLNEYQKMLEVKFKKIASSELMITDRLHGVIFAAITKTPCIAIDNFNYKIRGMCEWLKEFKNIKYVQNYEELEKIIENIDLREKTKESDLENLRNKFEILEERLKETNER